METPDTHGYLQWVFLAVAAFMCVGTNYVYDFPGTLGTGAANSIQSRFQQHGHDYTETMNQGLYASYSFPNTVLTVGGGLLLDHYLGMRRATVLFAVTALAGASVFLIGVSQVVYPLLVTGRVLCGCGCECLQLSQSAWLSRWFKGKKTTSLAFGLAVACQRFGSFLNFALSPVIASAHGVQVAAGVGVATTGLSLVAAFLVLRVDASGEAVGLVGPVSEYKKGTHYAWKELRNLPTSYWLLLICCFSFYTSILPFVGVAKNFLQRKYGYADAHASTVVGIYQITSAVCSPLLGSVIDRTGRPACWVLLAGVVVVGCLVTFAQAPSSLPPVIITVVMGLAFCLIAGSLFPSVPHIVKGGQIGVAYGFMTAAIAVTGATMRMVTGSVLDHHTDPDEDYASLTGFRELLHILTGFACLCTLAAATLIVVDLRGTTILTSTAAVRKELTRAMLPLQANSVQESSSEGGS